MKKFVFKELEELNLSNNPIKSIKGIEDWKFPNLFILSFYRTNISDITPLYEADFPNLTQLDLGFTKIKKYDDEKEKKDNKDKKYNKDKDKDKLKIEELKKCKNLKNIIFDKHF